MAATAARNTDSSRTDSTGQAPTGGTVDPAEVARFSAMAADWWNPEGKFKPLHKFNPLRLTYIRDAICAHHGRDPESERPLAGLRIIDIGCGGGLVAEPLALLGAEVVGLDASERNVRTAAAHAAESGIAIDYRQGTAEELAARGETFDVVLTLEILEHVADSGLFLKVCTDLIKPGGMLFLATLNRTPKAYALAIIGAEYILRWLPRGTHEWKKFVRPSEVAAALRPHGVTIRDLTGMVYNPLRDAFRLDSNDLDVNYMLWAVKAG